MISFSTVQDNGSNRFRGWRLVCLLAFFFSFSVQGTEPGSVEIESISDLDEVSVVTLNAGYGSGARPGMKLLAMKDGEPLAELIVIDVNEHQTHTLITEQFGEQPLEMGNQVKTKTINFAATWK